MITKYGYKLTNKRGMVIAEAWGFDNKESAIADYADMLANGFDSAEVEWYQTTHRNYFGKQFKQVACKRIN